MEPDSSIPVLDRKGLRDFSFVLGGAVAVIFGLLLPWLFAFSFPLWPWMVLAILAAWGLLLPESLGPVYRTWMRFGLLLNRITSPLILGLIFFLLIAPVGLIRRSMGRDSIAKGPDPKRDSYRIPSDDLPKSNLEKPF